MKNIAVLYTNRSYYDISEAGEASMTVRELIERLNELDQDMPIVFGNDNGYTYGYISRGCVSVDEVEEEEEDDPVVERPDMEYDLAEAVRKSKDGKVAVGSVWFTTEDGEDTRVMDVRFNDERVLGITFDDEKFVPLADLDDDDVCDIWADVC